MATQLVLHPLATGSVKLWSNSLGMEKTYRAAQYLARFLAYALLERGYKDEAARWNALKSHLTLGRKLLRLFKPLEHLQAALRASQSPNLFLHTLEQFVAISRPLAYATHLIFEDLVWANSIKFINLSSDRASRFQKFSQRFWLSGIIFSLILGVLKTRRLSSKDKALSKVEGKDMGTQAADAARRKAISSERAAVHYQLVIDLLDVWLPASGLGLVNVNEGAAGILGFITSVMALKTCWTNVNKA